ncbi:MAG: hypothetical protein H7A55_13555 [Verrucomicrobiaceae bacterium]|nr:hypothetical protein [Verrucomicrobiaceae bacterium]
MLPPDPRPRQIAVAGAIFSVLGAAIALAVSVGQWVIAGGVTAEPPVGETRTIAYVGMTLATLGGALFFLAIVRHDYHPRWVQRALVVGGGLLVANIPNLTIFGILVLGFALKNRAFFSEVTES